MDREQTRTLLSVRSSLTGEPYGEPTVEAWHEVLEPWSYDECRKALGLAGRHETSISPAHLIARLPGGSRLPAFYRGEPPMSRRVLALHKLGKLREHGRDQHEHEPDPHCDRCQLP